MPKDGFCWTERNWTITSMPSLFHGREGRTVYLVSMSKTPNVKCAGTDIWARFLATHMIIIILASITYSHLQHTQFSNCSSTKIWGSHSKRSRVWRCQKAACFFIMCLLSRKCMPVPASMRLHSYSFIWSTDVI